MVMQRRCMRGTGCEPEIGITLSSPRQARLGGFLCYPLHDNEFDRCHLNVKDRVSGGTLSKDNLSWKKIQFQFSGGARENLPVNFFAWPGRLCRLWHRPIPND